MHDITLFVRRAIPFLIVANVALALLGVLLYPSSLHEDGGLGIVADCVILFFYGFLALFSPMSAGKAPAGVVRRGALLGLVSALLLGADLVSNYFIARDATGSATSSLSAYGVFLALLVVAGFWSAAGTGRFAAGVQTAIWCVVVALSIWFSLEFASFYLFSGTPTGAQYMRLEMQTDFARSGSTDYEGFVMSDLFGAGFYHLALGLIVGTLLGSVGGGIGKLAGRRVARA